MDGASVVATLTDGSGGKVAGEITATTVGAATAGVEIVGTTAGVGTEGEQVMAVRGAVATLAGGTIDPTTVAVGMDGTITGDGSIDPTTDDRAVIGHATFAGGETNRFQRFTEPSAVAPDARVNFGNTRSQNRTRRVPLASGATALDSVMQLLHS